MRVVDVQIGGEMDAVQHNAEHYGLLSSLSGVSWVPPLPEDFLGGPVDGLLAVPGCDTMPGQGCAQGVPPQPTTCQPGGDEPGMAAATDLGSLLGPAGDSWMGPLAAAPQPASLQPAAPHMFAAQKPFHMLFPVLS